MTFIRESLYLDLKKEQEMQLSSISEGSAVVKALTDEIKVDEAFLAGFDDEQANLTKSMQGQDDAIASNSKLLDDLEKANDENNKAIEDQEVVIKKLEKELNELKENKASAEEIAAKEAEISAAQKVLSSLKNKRDTFETDMIKAKQKIKLAEDTKESLKVQIESNKDKKAELEEGEESLDEKKKQLTEREAEQKETEDKYSAWLEKNTPTMKAFEKQEENRNSALSRANNIDLYHRLRPKEENDLIVSENDVLREVVDLDLDSDNLTNDEKKLRSDAIEKGRSESVNPNYLSAEQAADLARASQFSTREFANDIKAAASTGKTSLWVGELSDAQIYALQESGYTVTLNSQTKKSGFTISWFRVEGES